MLIRIAGKSTVTLTAAVLSLLTLVPMVPGKAGAFTLVEQPKAVRQVFNPGFTVVRFSDFTASDVNTRIRAGATVIKDMSGRVIDNGMPEVMIDKESSDAINRELGIDKEDVAKAAFDNNRRIFNWRNSDGTDAISFGIFAASIAYMKTGRVDDAMSQMNDSSIIGLNKDRIKAIATALDLGNSYIAVPGLLKLFGIFGGNNVTADGFYTFASKEGWAVTNSMGQKFVRTDIGYAAVLTALVE